MSFRSSHLLQFDDLRSLVASYAGSAAGSERINAIAPASDRGVIEAALAEAAEAMAYRREAADAQGTAPGAAVRLRLDQLRMVDRSVALLRIEGSVLEGRAILDVLHTLHLSAECRQALLGAADHFPLLAQRGIQLADLGGLARRWERAFLPDGTLADEASVALGRMRRDIKRQAKQIQDSLERFLRAHHADGTLQEDFVTIRDDRYVVPIVAGQKGRVDGVIHGSSGTGRTLFVEPLETISLNNQLVRLREDEAREVERILAEITSSLREHSEEILISAMTLADLDAIFAKAAFAADYDCVIPRFSEADRRLVLQDARHPLLQALFRRQGKSVIPVSFELNEGQRCLLISGPNTGGKTVTLKTAGLLALMAHAALPVPAAEAEFPILDDVLADIGDSQSIAESLSSFSGHLLHVKEMLEDVTAGTLVLLDELGRATDPEEGGALGVAILDEFRKSGAFCLASTHLLPLKLYGARTAAVLNASMGFDDVTLQPTYRLRLGAPGKSAGLAIATRLQLPPVVLEHARAVLPRLEADFETLVSELHRQIEETAAHNGRLEEARRVFEKQRADVAREGFEGEVGRQREWERQAERLQREFEARAQAAIDQIKEGAQSRKAVEQAQRLTASTRRAFQEEAAAAMRPSASVSDPVVPTAELIVEGSKVRLKDIREVGTVRRILKNGMLEVEAGLLKLRINREDIVEVVSKTTERRLPSNVRFEAGPTFDVSYRELNVIGQRADEAIESVDKFLDSASLASVNRVRIIHGHGMGVLKRAVNDLLGRNPHVSRYYPATQGEGGSGATIVELRD